MAQSSAASAPRTAYAVLAAVSLSHLLNDTIQSLLPAIYPVLKVSFSLDFAQVGLMTLALMLTASVLQPVVGHDHRSAAGTTRAGRRHDLHARGSVAAVLRLDLSAPAAGRGARRRRVLGLSS